MLPYVQLATLTSPATAHVHQGDLDLDRLRATAAEAVGTDPPALVQLRRVTVGIGPAARAFRRSQSLPCCRRWPGFDLGELAEQVAEATWWLVAVAFVLTQLPRLTQALSRRSARPRCRCPSVRCMPCSWRCRTSTSRSRRRRPGSLSTSASSSATACRPAPALAAGRSTASPASSCRSSLLVSLLLFTSASLDLDLGRAVDSADAARCSSSPSSPWRRSSSCIVVAVGSRGGSSSAGRSRLGSRGARGRARAALASSARPAGRRQPRHRGAVRVGAGDVRPIIRLLASASARRC